MYAFSFIPRWLRRKISPFLVSAVAGSAAVPAVQYVPERAAWAEPNGDRAAAEKMPNGAEAAEEAKETQQAREKKERQAAFLSGLEEAVYEEAGNLLYRPLPAAGHDNERHERVTDVKHSLDGKQLRVTTSGGNRYHALHDLPHGTTISLDPFVVEELEKKYSSRRLFFGYDAHGLPAYFFRLRNQQGGFRENRAVQTGDFFNKLEMDKEYRLKDSILSDRRADDEDKAPPSAGLFRLLLNTRPDFTRETFCFSAGKILPALARENLRQAYETTDWAFSCIPPALRSVLLKKQQQHQEEMPFAHEHLAHVYDALAAAFSSFNTRYTQKTPDESALLDFVYRTKPEDRKSVLQLLAQTGLSLHDAISFENVSLSPDGTRVARLDLSGEGMAELDPAIGELDALQELDISGNNLRVLPPELGTLRLRALDARNNQLNALPAELGAMRTLERLRLGRNNLGETPPTFSGLASLVELDLSANLFYSLPLPIGELKELRTLNLEGNRLRTVSLSGYKLPSLEELNMRGNHSEELTIGPETRLPSLKKLNAAFNELRMVPPELASSAPQLVHLDLSDNHLSGLPDSFTQMRNLRYLDVHRNQNLALSADFFQQLPLLETYMGKNHSCNKVPEIVGTRLVCGYPISRANYHAVYAAQMPVSLTGYFRSSFAPFELFQGMEIKASAFPLGWHYDFNGGVQSLSLPLVRDWQVQQEVFTSFAHAHTAQILLPHIRGRMGVELGRGAYAELVAGIKGYDVSVNQQGDSLTLRKSRYALDITESFETGTGVGQAGVGFLLQLADDQLAVHGEYVGEAGFSASARYIQRVQEKKNNKEASSKKDITLHADNVRAHHLRLLVNYQPVPYLFLQTGMESSGNAGLLCRAGGCRGDFGDERRVLGIGYVSLPRDFGVILSAGFEQERVHAGPIGYEANQMMVRAGILFRTHQKAALIPEM